MNGFPKSKEPGSAECCEQDSRLRLHHRPTACRGRRCQRVWHDLRESVSTHVYMMEDFISGGVEYFLFPATLSLKLCQYRTQFCRLLGLCCRCICLPACAKAPRQGFLQRRTYHRTGGVLAWDADGPLLLAPVLPGTSSSRWRIKIR